MSAKLKVKRGQTESWRTVDGTKDVSLDSGQIGVEYRNNKSTRIKVGDNVDTGYGQSVQISAATSGDTVTSVSADSFQNVYLFALDLGSKYRVKLDGAEYDCICYKDDLNSEYTSLGNSELSNNSSSLGQPFLIKANIHGAGITYYFKNPGDHTIQIKLISKSWNSLEYISPDYNIYTDNGIRIPNESGAFEFNLINSPGGELVCSNISIGSDTDICAYYPVSASPYLSSIGSPDYKFDKAYINSGYLDSIYTSTLQSDSILAITTGNTLYTFSDSKLTVSNIPETGGEPVECGLTLTGIDSLKNKPLSISSSFDSIDILDKPTVLAGNLTFEKSSMIGRLAEGIGLIGLNDLRYLGSIDNPWLAIFSPQFTYDGVTEILSEAIHDNGFNRSELVGTHTCIMMVGPNEYSHKYILPEFQDTEGDVNISSELLLRFGTLYCLDGQTQSESTHNMVTFSSDTTNSYTEVTKFSDEDPQTNVFSVPTAASAMTVESSRIDEEVSAGHSTICTNGFHLNIPAGNVSSASTTYESECTIKVGCMSHDAEYNEIDKTSSIIMTSRGNGFWVYPSGYTVSTGQGGLGTNRAPWPQVTTNSVKITNMIPTKTADSPKYVNVTVDADGQLLVSNSIIPKASGSYSLGSSKKLWSELHAKNGTIQTSDRSEKDSIHYILHDNPTALLSIEDTETTNTNSTEIKSSVTIEDVIDFISDLDPVTFCYKHDDVEVATEDNTKSESIQLGLIANDIENHKLFKYIGVKSEYDEVVKPEERDESGELISEAVTEKQTMLGLQPIPLAVAALTGCKYLLTSLREIEDRITDMEHAIANITSN